MKKIIAFLLIFTPFLTNAFDTETQEVKTQKAQDTEFKANDDKLYKESYTDIVSSFCEEKFKFSQNISSTDKYIKATEILTSDDKEVIKRLSKISNEAQSVYELPIYFANDLYKENMNNIYKCWIILTQEQTKNDISALMKKNTSDISKIVQPVISKQEKIFTSEKKNYCSSWENNTNLLNKTEVLKRVTFETCKYNIYMEALKKYYNETENTIEDSAKRFWATNSKYVKNTISTPSTQTELLALVSWLRDTINTQIDKAYEVYPIVFTAYSEYENNYKIHKYNELLIVAFNVYKTALYKALSPINQVVYKIINAMEKP